MRQTNRPAAFWSLGVVLGLCLFAASAPSPLYATWAALFRFPPSTLTEIYAVYAFGALAALLVTGRLSDHVGRRPVVVLALAIQIAGVAAFIVARGVEALFLGRILQGIGTGVASSALSAWLLDLQPRTDPRLGGLVGGIAPLAGLGAGALGSGLLIQSAPDPLHLVFWLLAIAFAVAALVTVFLLPDVSPRRSGWLRSMWPELGVPLQARSAFVALTPSIAAVWALGGLYLSLGPSLALSLLRTDSPVAGGGVVTALLGTGAVASVIMASRAPRLNVIGGLLLIVVGVVMTLAAVAGASPPGLYAGVVVAGLGFGPAFSGSFRSLAALAPPDERGALVASIYVVLYVSFSVPTILAGIAVSPLGIVNTTYVYGVVVVLLALLTVITFARRSSHHAATAG